MKTILAALLLLIPFIASAQDGERSEETTETSNLNRVIIIPIRDQIAPPELYILRRGLKTAIEQGADTVILDMETPGGRLDVTFDMLKAIEKFPGKVYTYVNSEAISAGALISAGTSGNLFFSYGNYWCGGSCDRVVERISM